ncbi:hypothetical protein ACP4OV_013740 [Aristida adscensionis]
MSGAVHDCDVIVDKYSDSLRNAAVYLKQISNIDTEDWDLLVTCLKMICYPDEQITVGNPEMLFSVYELSRLVVDGPKYEQSGVAGLPTIRWLGPSSYAKGASSVGFDALPSQ